MLVIDTSALIAIMLGEAGALGLRQRIAAEPHGARIVSVVSYVEAGTVIAGRRASDPIAAISEVDAVLAAAGIDLVAADEAQAQIALDARIRFGKGFGARAKLNFGDCFAYALAKQRNAPLLFVGDDFAATDVTTAL